LQIKHYLLCAALICTIAVFWRIPLCVADGDEGGGSEIVSCANGYMKIDAKDIRPEDLMKEIGEKCGIKIVVYGEAFTETPVSLKLQKAPVRKGVERVLRVVNIPNFLMHFEKTDNGTRVAELDLIGKKGGEKHLTAGAVRPAQPVPPPEEKRREPIDRREEKKAVRDQVSPEESSKMQENFLKIMEEVMKSQADGGGEEPDPGEILKLFKEAVPQEMKDQIPPEVMEELEKLESVTGEKK